MSWWITRDLITELICYLLSLGQICGFLGKTGIVSKLKKKALIKMFIHVAFIYLFLLLLFCRGAKQLL